MVDAAKTPNFDIYALSVEVGERFDEVPWKRFNDANHQIRTATRQDVLTIRDDLMKVAAADPGLAAKVWDDHVPSFVPRPAELPRIDETLNPVNTIEPGRKRRKAAVELFSDLSGAGASDVKPSGPRSLAPAAEAEPQAKTTQANPVVGENASDPALNDPKAERMRILLEGLERQYLKADDRYHFRDRGREVAFAAEDKRIMTQHETAPVISSMIDLAESRGWNSVKLTGTDEFKKEAWLQASLRDFEVSGYRPTKLDKARLDELRGERGGEAPAPNVVAMGENAPAAKAVNSATFKPTVDQEHNEPKLDLTRGQAQVVKALEATMVSRGDLPDVIAQARELANEQLRSSRVHVGKLVEVGTAPYQNKPGEAKSHFVTLEDGGGKRTQVWGMDFPRALNESGAAVGQQVALAFRGRETVSIKAPIRDETGKSMGTAHRDVERNMWNVVPLDRLRDDAKARVLEAVRKQDRPANMRVFDRSAPQRAPAADMQVARPRSKEQVR